jgi:hypothetical protein
MPQGNQGTCNAISMDYAHWWWFQTYSLRPVMIVVPKKNRHPMQLTQDAVTPIRQLMLQRTPASARLGIRFWQPVCGVLGALELAMGKWKT